MKKFIFLFNCLLPISAIPQSLVLFTTYKNEALCIKNIEKNKTVILDSVYNYELNGYRIIGDSLECISKIGEKKYYYIGSISKNLNEKKEFSSKLSEKKTQSYCYREFELYELDYNLILCAGSQIKWEIVNTKNGRRPKCESDDLEVNKKLKLFGHPVLSNKGDYFIYNQEKWNWASSTFKTFEVNMNTGKQEKLFNGLNTQISPTDRYLLFQNIKNEYFVYDRVMKTRNSIYAETAYWLYK